MYTDTKAAIPSLQHLCNVFSSQLARDLCESTTFATYPGRGMCEEGPPNLGKSKQAMLPGACYSPNTTNTPVILRPLLIIAYTCTILLNLQIPLEIARRAARRDLTGRWWTAAVGEWAGRIQLEEKA